MNSLVEAIGTYCLVLNSGFVFDLEKTFYVSSFSRNLITILRFILLGFSFNFSNGNFNLYYKSKIVGTSPMSDGLFQLNLQDNVPYTINVGVKRSILNENSSCLWHCRLWHISLESIKRLVNNGVLSTLDFTDFDTCIDCIKGN